MLIDGSNAVPPGIGPVELKVTLGAKQVGAGLAGFALEPGSARSLPKQQTKTSTVLQHLATSARQVLA